MERHLRVHRTARFRQLGHPGKATEELWVACHGYGQLAADFASALEPLRDDVRVVVAPEALSRFYLDDPAKRHGPDSPIGASWMTREDRDREIADYVGYLDSLAATLRREIGHDVPVTALGFSQGVATVSRWATLGNTQLRLLILWGGTMPPELATKANSAALRGASVVLVGGRRDHLVSLDALEREATSLRAHGVPVDLESHDGGHALSSELLRRLAARNQ